MRPTISATREALGRLFHGRCFYLFVTMLVLVALAPFVEARTAVMLEGIVGQLFIAILIAHLFGVYPQPGVRS